MELLCNLGQENEKGILLPVPTPLKRQISSWATSFYYKYPFGYGLIQHFLTKKFSIHIWRIYAHLPGKLYPACKQPTIAIQAMIEGEIPCLLSGFGNIVLKNSFCELFYVPIGINEAWFDPGDYLSFHVELAAEFLSDIAEVYPDAMELLLRFNNASEYGMPMVAVRINYIMRAIFKSFQECSKVGGDLIIEFHRYIVDFLSEYVTDIREQEGSSGGKNVTHKDILLRIKQEIVAEPNIESQGIRKLALKFKIGMTELKKEFKELFGKPPGSFVRFHALAKAHYLIVSTHQSIEAIAYEVGYGYRSNFDKTFKKHFGYLPASLRRNGADRIH